MMQRMEQILTPIAIGSVTLKNRIVFPSMCLNYCDEDGRVTRRLKEFVMRRASGGVGAIIVPGSHHGRPGPRRPAISDEKYLSGWSELVSLCDQFGCKLFCQLHPSEKQAGHSKTVKMPVNYSLDEIKELIRTYARGAAMAQKAGLAGVEIHGAHAHEVAQFMSPYYNKRSDEFGGSPRGRAKFALEIVQAIKERCGESFPVIFRLSGREMLPGGRELDESAFIAGELEKVGADAIHVSIGLPESEQWICAPMDVSPGYNVASAARIKKAVRVPVIAVGRILNLKMAEEIVNNGQADLIAMGRATLADPALVEKTLLGEPRLHCIGCNQGCKNPQDVTVHCLQNPETGREGRFNTSPITGLEKVIVAGAGPAGLEAAVVLCRRGVKPLVFEKKDIVGGQLRAAIVPPGKAEMAAVVSDRLKILERYGVTVQTGVEVNRDLVEQLKPSLVIVATGSTAIMPSLPGLNDEKVYAAEDVLLNGSAEEANTIAIIGGGLVGCETADYLSARGKKVTIYEELSEILFDLNLERKTFLLQRLQENKVMIRLSSRVESVAGGRLHFVSQGKREISTPYDAIVIAVGRKPVDRLRQELRDKNLRLLTVGDAASPGNALQAILSAAEAVSSL